MTTRAQHVETVLRALGHTGTLEAALAEARSKLDALEALQALAEDPRPERRPASTQARSEGFARGDGSAPNCTPGRGRRLSVSEIVGYEVGEPEDDQAEEKPERKPRKPKASAAEMDERRKQIATTIRLDGPQKTAALASRLGLHHDSVNNTLRDHPWFEQEQDGWHLTAAGFAAVNEGREG